MRVHAARHTVHARVVSLHGDQVILDAGAPREDDDGSPEQALLAFEHGGRMITLSGTAFPGERPGLLRFLCTDGVRLADKRQHERLQITLPATVTTLDTAAAMSPVRHTQLVDISAGGLLLAQDGLAGVLRVTITLPGVESPITAVAEVIRTGVPGTAVMFRSIEPSDRAVIEAFVGNVKHALAKRFATAAAG